MGCPLSWACFSAISASSPSAARQVFMPQAESVSSSTRRFVALSSTIRTGTPSNVTGAVRFGSTPALARPNRAVKWKVLPSPGSALHPDPALHHCHQARRNRQSQAGTAEPPGGGDISLRESLEDKLFAYPEEFRFPYRGPRSGAQNHPGRRLLLRPAAALHLAP